MVTPEQAEQLAQRFMQEYVAQCGCNTTDDVGCVLTKMVSMCGLGMCATIGQPAAVQQLQATAEHVARTQSGKNWTMHKAN